MRRQRNYVETWRAIALYVGRSPRWCRYAAEREGDPLPVHRVGAFVRLEFADFEAWEARQRAAVKPTTRGGHAS